MKPTILRGELLMWVMHLVSDCREEAERVLSATDRWAVESVVGTACQDQVALDEYLHALQGELGVRPADAGPGLDDSFWDALFRDGLSVLPDSRLLAVAASAGAIREFNARVGAALVGGTLAAVWQRHPEVMADRMSEAEMDQFVRETADAYCRRQADATTTILPADDLARVMYVLSAGRAEVVHRLAAADRCLIEEVLGSACHGPVARDEYLAALARSAEDRPGGVFADSYKVESWLPLLRDGLPGLSDEALLALAAAPDAIRELNERVGAALRDGTLTDIWWSYYDAFPLPPDPVMDERLRETVEVFRRRHAEWTEGKRQGEAPRTPDADGTD